MPKRFTDGYFALGLTIGILSTVLLALFFSSGYEPSAQLPDTINQGPDNADQCGDGNQPVWGPWLGLCFGLHDSLAQWFMMAFTIIAAALLYGTLIQAGKTNIAALQASNAALEANQIIRNEQRPWVTLRRDVQCDYFERDQWGISVAWNHNFENMGKSPAHNIRLRTKAIRVDHLTGLGRELRSFVESQDIRSGSVDETILFPQEKTDFWRYYSTNNNSFTRYKEDVFGQHTILLVCLTYQFGADADSERGVEGRVLGFEERKDTIGPFGHNMLEYANFRIVR